MTDVATRPDLRSRLRLVVEALFDGNTVTAAAAAGVEQSTIYRIVEGQTTDPRTKTVERIADGLNIPPQWLLGETRHLPEEEQGRSPTWLVLIDRYFDKRQQPMLLELDRAESRAGHVKPRIQEFHSTRQTAQKSVLGMLGVLEAIGAENAEQGKAMAAYRASRELETATMERLVAWLRRERAKR